MTGNQIDIRLSQVQDIDELARTMRQKDYKEALALGIKNPYHALYYAFKHGLYKRTGLINNKIAAMWGVAGNPLGLVGQPYLVTSQEVLKVSPIRFARIYKQEVEIMLKLFPILENYVDARYKEAIGMLQIAGFDVLPPEKIFKGTFQKFSLRAT